MTPRQQLIAQFPSVCDPEWLATLKRNDTVLYCWRGGAGHLYPKLAKVVKTGKTFIDLYIDGYEINGNPYVTRISSDGMRRWYDVSYFAFIAPFSSLRAEFDKTSEDRRRYNKIAIDCGMKPFDFSTFESLYPYL